MCHSVDCGACCSGWLLGETVAIPSGRCRLTPLVVAFAAVRLVGHRCVVRPLPALFDPVMRLCQQLVADVHMYVQTSRRRRRRAASNCAHSSVESARWTQCLALLCGHRKKTISRGADSTLTDGSCNAAPRPQSLCTRSSRCPGSASQCNSTTPGTRSSQWRGASASPASSLAPCSVTIHRLSPRQPSPARHSLRPSVADGLSRAHVHARAHMQREHPHV